MAASRSCMNAACGAAAAAAAAEAEWRKGWALRAGGFANLCDRCGMAYEQLIFCDIFHSEESGWRECSSCGKLLHCGCMVSKASVELLDNGGVQCINCTTTSDPPSIRSSLIQGEASLDSLSKIPQRDQQLSILSLRDQNGNVFHPLTMGENIVHKGESSVLLVHRENTNGNLRHTKQDEAIVSVRDMGITSFSEAHQASITHSISLKKDDSKDVMQEKRIYDSLAQGCLSTRLGDSTPGNIDEVEGREHNTSQSAFQQGQRACHILPKPTRSSIVSGSASSKEVPSYMRVARPPGEGRGRNQLLPRYWPRITDQELQQMSGDTNSIIVPLFEKVLSASDAGRIGRLVLPKACAEAYFPPISQPEGIPLRIQDMKGKNWTFQFRFWPNNNSRMYVLEGVTPCIQSMQLQAGDTVIFSRIDPEGKLVMGFRKATSCAPLLDARVSAIAIGNGNLLSGITENSQIPFVAPERKRSYVIGSKSKRLHIDYEDALELKVTWEEAQDLLCAPPNAKPSITMIDGHEFEEYEEPPVFAKRTIFTVRTFGGSDQWAQCDRCNKWRRLPVNVLILSKWTCADNTWDPNRSSCFVPEEISPKELQNLLQLNASLRKQNLSASYKSALPESEVSASDTLATAAIHGDDANQSAPSIATTTKHPRHRPGCTCIVCIQPPSGKGPKHTPTCVCNVCTTVKRRFQTLRMRKQRCHSECEEAETHGNRASTNKYDTEADNHSKTRMSLDTVQNRSDFGCKGMLSGTGKEQIHLNCQPQKE